MKKILRLIPALLAALVFLAATTISWLAIESPVVFPDSFGGSTKTAYFAGGDGSKEKPYIISNSVHLYNLAWLQYLGYFNLGSKINNGRAQSFFKLAPAGNNLDMNGLAIPPIGTREYPFIGKFDGNDKVISNFTVSNSKTDLKKYPRGAEFSGNILTTTGNIISEEVNIVGLFGVTGDFMVSSNASFVSAYYTLSNTNKNLNIQEKEADGETLVPLPSGNTDANDFYYSGMSISGFYADKITVASVSHRVLVGLIAGYVSSTVENTGVYRSKILIEADTTGGVNDLFNSANKQVNYGTVVSRYSLVGDYDDNVVGWTEDPSSSSDSGTTLNFGGSIDMRTLNRRLGYMFAQGETRYSGGSEYSDSDFYSIHLETDRSSATDPEYYWGNTGILTMYLLDGTVIPLNVDKKAMLLDTFTTDNETEPSASNNYHHTHSKYDGVTPEVLLNNTGYLVAGNESDTVRAGIRLLTGKGTSWSSYYPGIFNSFGYSYSTEPASVVVYDETHKARFALFTKDVNGNTYRIIDSVNQAYYNGNTKYADKQSSEFNRYDKVRENFDETMENSKTLHGFMFYHSSSGIRTDLSSGVTSGSYTVVDGVELIKGGLNFTLEKQGYVTTILAAGFASGEHSLFDLYKVKRTDEKVDTITKINKIYVKTENGEEVSYYEDLKGNIYRYDATTKTDVAVTDTTGLTLAFDLNSLEKTNSLDASCAFYFEMLLSPGDYFIGKDYCWTYNYTDNAYIMYLDIGANGDGETPDPGTKKLPYIMQSVDFVSMPENGGDTLTVPADYPSYADVGFELGFGTDKTAISDEIFYRRENYAADFSGEIATKVYYWRKNADVAIKPSSSEYGEENETEAKW